MNVLTIIVLLLIAFYALGGYRKGFVKILMSMIFFVLAAVLVYLANPYVSGFLKEHTPVYEFIGERCQEVFTLENLKNQVGNQEEETEGSTEADTSSLTRVEQMKVIEDLWLPQVLKDQLVENNNAAGYAKLAVENFEAYISGFMANLILNIFSYVVTFLVVVTFLRMTVMTMDVLTAIPGIRGLNKILGFFLGIFQGVLMVWIIFLIITIFSGTEPGGNLMVMIQKSPILAWLYDENVLLRMVSGVFGSLM